MDTLKYQIFPYKNFSKHALYPVTIFFDVAD